MMEKLREIQLEILNEVDRICKKNGITYHLYAGTLLGAIRHSGFIPWDDDIDISMLRSEYEKFLEVCKNDLKSEFKIEIPDVRGRLHIAKVIKKGTILQEYDMKSTNNRGIYIDLFPLDNSMPSTFSGKKQEIKIWYLFIIKRLMYPDRLKHKKSIIKTFIKTVMFFVLFPLRVYYTKNRLFEKIERTVKKFNDYNTGYVCELSHGMIRGKYKRNSYDIKDIKNTVLVRFEKNMYPAPKEYHKILTKHYGEYMKLPPIIDQVPAHIEKVSFDGEIYYDKYGDIINKEMEGK